MIVYVTYTMHLNDNVLNLKGICVGKIWRIFIRTAECFPFVAPSSVNSTLI